MESSAAAVLAPFLRSRRAGEHAAPSIKCQRLVKKRAFRFNLRLQLSFCSVPSCYRQEDHTRYDLTCEMFTVDAVSVSVVNYSDTQDHQSYLPEDDVIFFLERRIFSRSMLLGSNVAHEAAPLNCRSWPLRPSCNNHAD